MVGRYIVGYTPNDKQVSFGYSSRDNENGSGKSAI